MDIFKFFRKAPAPTAQPAEDLDDAANRFLKACRTRSYFEAYKKFHSEVPGEVFFRVVERIGCEAIKLDHKYFEGFIRHYGLALDSEQSQRFLESMRKSKIAEEPIKYAYGICVAMESGLDRQLAASEIRDYYKEHELALFPDQAVALVSLAERLELDSPEISPRSGKVLKRS